MRRPLSMFCAILLSSALTCGAVDYSRTIAEISQYITNQLDVTGASSLALVLMDGDRVVLVDGFGLADPVEGMAADADTIYCIGSISKTFAAFSAMRWRDRGLLDLDAPVTNIVPSFGFHERFSGSPPITTRLLMNHQSGLPGHYEPYAIATVPYPFYGELTLAGMAEEYPICPPNFIDAYNNNGFTLLEAVLTALSGRTFVAELTADVFQRLGMTNTFYLTDPRQLARPARAMIGTNVYPTEVLNIHASGGVYSSANDMRRAVEMLLGDGFFRGTSFLSSNAIATMLTYQGTNLSLSSRDPLFKFGLGFDSVAGAELAYAGRSCYKGGDTVSHHSWMEIMPDHGLGVAVMANGGVPSMSVAQRALMLAVRDKFGIPLPTNGVPMPDSPPVAEPPFPWGRLAGYYAHGSGVARVTAANGRLALQLKAWDPDGAIYTNLAPHENGLFWDPGNPDFQLSFTNVMDRLFASVRMNSGRYWTTILLGERIEPARLADKWLHRAQKQWIPADWDPFSFTWDMPDDFRSEFNDPSGGGRFRARRRPWSMPLLSKSELTASDGFLVFSHQAFDPVNDVLAIPFITGRHDRGTLSAVEMGGEEWLRLSGVHYRPLADIPVLSAPGSTNAVLAGDIIGWYRVPKTGGGRLEVNIAGHPLPRVRLMNDDFTPLNTIRPATGRYLAAPTGDVYVAVTRGLEGGMSYTLRTLWRAVESDYDGDLKSDPAVYQEVSGIWRVLLSGSGHSQVPLQFGGPGYAPISADYDGDGQTDPAVYHAASGTWLFRLSGSSYQQVQLDDFGGPGFRAVRGDFDGDGKADPAVYDEATGTWLYRRSSQGYASEGVRGFGGPGFVPVPADYNGDGKTDPAIYHEASGTWFIRCSTDAPGTDRYFHLGGQGYRPVYGDFDGDGLADPAVYHVETGHWMARLSGTGQVEGTIFGGPGMLALPADFDGDGLADPAVFRTEDATWGAQLSGSGYAVGSARLGGAGPGYIPVR